MGNVKVVDNLPRFSRNIEQLIDMAFKELSQDIHRKAVTKYAPKKHGDLRADSYPLRMGLMHWRIYFNREYALRQEQHEFSHYTTAGTGSRYLQRAGDEESRKALGSLKKYMGRAKA